MAKIKYYLPGSLLILSGIFIVVFPEILIALFASIVIIAGIAVLYIGKRLSESEQDSANILRNRSHDDYSDNYWMERKPVFRYYRRWF